MTIGDNGAAENASARYSLRSQMNWSGNDSEELITNKMCTSTLTVAIMKRTTRAAHVTSAIAFLHVPVFQTECDSGLRNHKS